MESGSSRLVDDVVGSFIVWKGVTFILLIFLVIFTKDSFSNL